MDSLRSGNRPGAGRRCLWHELQERFGNRITLNGHPAHRLPNTLNVSFVNCIGAEILKGLDGVAASTGSACHAGRIKLSPVLQAMGVTPEVGMGAIRFSLGRGTTREEIDAVAERLSRLPATAFMTMSAGKPAE
jgi:cysteine desulfurase